MDAITVRSVVEAKPEPLAAPLAEGLVILQVETDRYYNLNELGTEVWGLIQKPTTVNEIVDNITSTHDVDAERCEADIVSLLQDMARARLITVR
ncbi:PqqD family protein [Fodinicurvata sp. EGI_FJ10296]|uniref:PqqD family protein n=1 Tax=Fodinicurvata sp. EGI_FJ10296 TaxID=3231908 RepID=UPI003454C846